MIRYTLLVALVAGLIVLALRHWFWALCGLIVMTVLTQHPSMPTNMFGIQGMNPWNLVLVVVILGWFMQRDAEPDAPPTPTILTVAVGAYIAVVVLSGLLAAIDGVSLRAMLRGQSIAQWLLVDGIINPLKYFTIGLLAYDGARTRTRVIGAMFAAVGSAMAYAFLMFKSMKMRVFTVDFEDARRMTDKLIGLFANDIGELLAFTIWAAIALLFLLRARWQKGVWALAILAVIPPFIALKSRAGFLAFLAVGALLGVLRWRKILVALPVAIAVVLMLSPSVLTRVTSGFESNKYNWDEISAGRLTNIWPPVIDQIGQAPLVGHGRYAILREDCAAEIIYAEGTLPGHPHNSYLEILLDAGLIGLAVCALLLFHAFRSAWKLMQYDDTLLRTLGTVALAALVAELSAGVAGSSFFPTQSMVPYLCVWGMSIRVQQQVEAASVIPAPAPPPSLQPARVVAT